MTAAAQGMTKRIFGQWEWWVLIAAFVSSAIFPPLAPVFFLGSTVCAAARKNAQVRLVSLVLTGATAVLYALIISRA